MKNVWLMKTYLDWSKMFIEDNFVAIDEDGVDQDYGDLTESQRKKLFEALKNLKPNKRWGQMKRFFDDFYDEMATGDLLVIGIGQTSKFSIAAIVEIAESDSYFEKDETARHRRKVRIIWQGEPVEMNKWGWARRLEKLDTADRLKEFIEAYTKLVR